MQTPVDIPKVDIGSSTIPRLFLGDHGYLAKLDSVLTIDEVVASMQKMLATTSVGIAAGETRVIDAAIRALCGAHVGRLMIHADTQALFKGERIRYRHLAATTISRFAELGLDIEADPILGFLHETGAQGDRIPSDVVGDLQLDESALQVWETDIRRAQPSIVSVGGDWLDLLMLVGRRDLALEGISRLAKAAASSGAAVVATTYVGALVDPKTIGPVLHAVDGLLVPLNHSGFGMLPSAGDHLAWLQRVNKPVVGMHVLVGGSSPGLALKWLDLPFVAALVVGAASEPHQHALATAANDHFRKAGE